MPLRIKYSRHAREQMVERGISEREVEECIKRGAKRLQTRDKILSEYRYYAAVYKKADDTCFVITIKPRW